MPAGGRFFDAHTDPSAGARLGANRPLNIGGTENEILRDFRIEEQIAVAAAGSTTAPRQMAHAKGAPSRGRARPGAGFLGPIRAVQGGFANPT